VIVRTFEGGSLRSHGEDEFVVTMWLDFADLSNQVKEQINSSQSPPATARSRFKTVPSPC
jgi:hypothetical protein